MFSMITNAVFGAALATNIAMANMSGVVFDNGYDYITCDAVAEMAFQEDEESYNYWIVMDNGVLGYNHDYK